MLTNFSSGTPVEILFFDINIGNPILKSGIISEITDNSVFITEDTYSFQRIEIQKNDIINIKKKEMNSKFLKAFLDFSKISEELEKKKNEVILFEKAKEKQKKFLNEIIFLENYSVDGAVNYLNGIAKQYPPFSVNEASISFSFFKNSDDEIEVSIKTIRKFEFYNTTSQSDIDKAADTYAPDIKEDLRKYKGLFENIFLVNRFSRKISDYLYESVSEYNGEFKCTKDNFFEKKETLDKFVKDNA